MHDLSPYEYQYSCCSDSDIGTGAWPRLIVVVLRGMPS